MRVDRLHKTNNTYKISSKSARWECTVGTVSDALRSLHSLSLNPIYEIVKDRKSTRTNERSRPKSEIRGRAHSDCLLRSGHRARLLTRLSYGTIIIVLTLQSDAKPTHRPTVSSRLSYTS